MRFTTVTVVDRNAPADTPPILERDVYAADLPDAIRDVVDELVSDYTLTPTYVDHADGSATVLITQRSDGATVGTLDVTTS